MDYTLLQKLVNAHGVNGNTQEVRDVVKQLLKDMGVEFGEHPYGSIYFGNSENPKKMVAAHIDEVGFQVIKIEENGTLRIVPSGSITPNRLDHTVVYIQTDTQKLPGVVFGEEQLKETSVNSFASLFVDIGANSMEEATKMGVRVGLFGSYKKDYVENNETVFAPSIDNRVSVFTVLALVAEDKSYLKDNLFIFQVDEETQDHNARGICQEYRPDLAVILDQAPTHQKSMPGDAMGQVGKGPMVMYRGGHYVLHEKARAYFDTKLTTPFQKCFMSPETLPNLEPAFYEENLHTVGVNVCIPTYGYHGSAFTVRKSDIEKTLTLLKEILQTQF